jgi:CHAD domain-containing protein
MLPEATIVVHNGEQDLEVFLEGRLTRAWRSFRDRLERCRERCTEKSLHQLRVEARRLMAVATVLNVVIPERHLEELTRRVKEIFRQSSQLRDTHVRACLIEEEFSMFPELKPLRKLLQKKEKKLRKKWQERVDEIKEAKLKKLVHLAKGELSHRFRDARSIKRCQSALLREIDQAHERTVRLLGLARDGSPARIHRLRIAFKKLRYLIEVLEPLIPDLSRRDLRHMNMWQETMGEIQDTAILRSLLKKYHRKTGERNFRRFEMHLARREHRLTLQFLASADRLVAFWPPSSNAVPRGSEPVRRAIPARKSV